MRPSRITGPTYRGMRVRPSTGAARTSKDPSQKLFKNFVGKVIIDNYDTSFMLDLPQQLPHLRIHMYLTSRGSLGLG